MADDGRRSLEAALAKTEADAEATLKAANVATRALKRFRTAAQVGNLRELGPSIDAAQQAINNLERQLASAGAGWDFDEEAYFAGGDFQREVVAIAEQQGVRVFDEDDRLYCSPVLVRVLPTERAVQVDKARERRLRPSVLVAHLKALQTRPRRFRTDAFLESLFEAYEALVAKHGRSSERFGRIEKLLDVYALLTLLPGSGREYSRQEFGRDLYLLDRSGVTATRRGYRVAFHASSGSRSAAGTIRVIDEDGRDRIYYGISFTSGE